MQEDAVHVLSCQATHHPAAGQRRRVPAPPRPVSDAPPRPVSDAQKSLRRQTAVCVYERRLCLWPGPAEYRRISKPGAVHCRMQVMASAVHWRRNSTPEHAHQDVDSAARPLPVLAAPPKLARPNRPAAPVHVARQGGQTLPRHPTWRGRAVFKWAAGSSFLSSSSLLSSPCANRQLGSPTALFRPNPAVFGWEKAGEIVPLPSVKLAYDDTHRPHMIADQNMPLRPVHASGWFPPYSEDGLYGPTPPWMGPYLPLWLTGGMTVTLEDMAMITALPLEGAAVTGMIQSEGWQDMHFNVCPADADDDIVERHARVWLWHFVSSFMFPDAAGSTAWPFADSVPPYAYVWKNAEAVRGPPRRRYTAYTNEIDCLIGNQVEWTPYRHNELAAHLSFMCTRDQDLWRTPVPMICYYIVEWHLPHRVTRQFGKRQINDWRVTHQDYLHMWEQRQRHNIAEGEGWFAVMEYNMEDVDTDAEDDYDVDTRWGNQLERANLHDHILSRIVNDAGVAMRHGNDARFLRSFVEVEMALKLNCVTANPMDPARAPGGSAPGGSSAMAGPSSSHRAGKAPASPQASDEDEPGDDSEDSPAPGQMNMTQTQRESSQDSDGDAQPRRRRRPVPIAYRPGYVGSVGQQMSSAHQIRGAAGGGWLCRAGPPGAAVVFGRGRRPGAAEPRRQPP
nr:unnamed protein product [Digitaria exilis]